MTRPNIEAVEHLGRQFERLEHDQRAGRRRRTPLLGRSRTAIAACALGLVLSGVAVAAVTEGEPELDALLNRVAPGADELPPGVPPSALERLGARPEAKSEPLRVSVGDKQAVAVGYLTESGQVCTAKVLVGAEPTGESPVGATGHCLEVEQLMQVLSRSGALCCGLFDQGAVRLVDGFVDPGVERVSVRSGSGPVAAQLSEPWSAGEGNALKYFLAVIEDPPPIDGTGGRLPIPPLELSFADGRVVEVVP